MQDVQNIPNPDVNSPEIDDGYGRNSDIEQPDDSIPVPPDTPPPPAVDEPEEDRHQPPIREDQTEPKMFV